jgi:hypothetical protein
MKKIETIDDLRNVIMNFSLDDIDIDKLKELVSNENILRTNRIIEVKEKTIQVKSMLSDSEAIVSRFIVFDGVAIDSRTQNKIFKRMQLVVLEYILAFYDVSSVDIELFREISQEAIILSRSKMPDELVVKILGMIENRFENNETTSNTLRLFLKIRD